MKRSNKNLFEHLQVGINADCSIASQIADQIRWMIVTNEIKRGEKLPAVRILANQLNVNFHTVSAAYRILEDNKLISTRRGAGSEVIEYSPSDTVSNNNIPTNTFGIIVPDLKNPFYPAFLSGAAKIARQYNFLMITCDTQEKIHTGKAFFDMLISKRVDGMLISPMGDSPQTNDLFDESDFYDFPIPLVFVDRPNVKGYSVLIDAKGAGYAATQHLYEHGHDEIALITGNLSIPTLRDCFNGYLSALEKHGSPYLPENTVEVKRFSYQEGYDAAKKLIGMTKRSKAIFVAGDILAIGAMKAFQEHHIRIPEDVAMVGYNDIDVSSFINPTLTSVTIPVERMGEESTKLLIRLFNKQNVEKKPIMMPTQLVIRESCGCNTHNEKLDMNKEVKI